MISFNWKHKYAECSETACYCYIYPMGIDPAAILTLVEAQE